MNVNNNVTELSSIGNKLEFKNTQEAINSSTQKLFGKQSFSLETGNNKNQLYKMGDISQEDIKDAVASQPSEFVKSALTALGNIVTADGLVKADEDGYNLADTQVKTIVTVTDKIQIYLATHCEDYQVTGDISREAIEQVTGSTPIAYAVANKLQESNLPITKDNVEESLEAMELASQLKPITDGTAKYMLNNGLTPTIENIYKAEFSAQSTSGGTYGAGYFTEGTGYYGKTTDEFNWDSLHNQMSKVIEKAGLEVNEDTLSDAKWFIENHLPLTEDAIKEYEALKDISLPVDQEVVLDSIIQALQEGKRPAKALLSKEDSSATRARDACEVVTNTTDETIKKVIASKQPINLFNLKKAQEGLGNGEQLEVITDSATHTSEIAKASTITTESSTIQVSEDNIAFITARRQLEEIRLQMTAEANYTLLKQGISIETKGLSALIEDLRNAENSYYKQLLSNDNIVETEENITSLREITTKVSEIRFLPNTVLASVVAGETANTINGIHSAGTALKNTYDAANQSYEALMTKPRSDMGDTITKAFQNVEDILADLGLETTESNQRAVRILGYNSMEITSDNINSVKAVDAAVNNTISNLTPKVVLNMIREGMNPLNTNMNDLNIQIREMQSQLGEDNTQEKYSEFLWKLEKNDEITTSEREAYVGMYRLINNVEKTDGAVIGALVNQNADITLNNLLTGVRNIKNRGMDVKIDDSFGELESLSFKATSISEQLASGFQENSSNLYQNESGKKESEASTYYNNLVDKALREIAPDKLSQIFEKGNIKDLSLEQFVDELVNSKENGELTKEYYKEQLTLMKEASQVEQSVVKMLTDFKQPITINNLLAANSLMTKRGSMFQKLLSKEDEKGDVTAATDNIINAITSKEDLTQAYAQLEQVVISSLDEQSEQTKVTSVDLKELKLLRNEIKLTTSLSKEEKYEIPVRIGDEITSINLTVMHSGDSSKVSITMDNDTIGKAAAEFTLKDKSASGYIVTDSQNGLEILKENKTEFNALLEEAGLALSKVDYMTSKSLNLDKFGEELESETTHATNDTSTKDLYSVARAFVVAIQKASSNEV